EPLVVTAADGGGQRSLLQTEKGVEISSLTVDGKSLLVRLFNAEAKVPIVRLYVGFSATAAVQVELDGKQVKVLPIQTDKKGRRWVELSIPRFGIRTIKFEHV
ncbi:MAG TPA: glycosyl hydrolase, partial [Niastella sp.]